MSAVPRSKVKFILVIFLVLMLGVSVWINRTYFLSGENEGAVIPPIDAKDEADQLIQLASQNYFYHEFDQAAENYHKAIRLFEERKNFKRAAKIYESLGDLYKFSHRSKEAVQNYLLAVDYHNRLHNGIGEGRAMESLADFYRERSQFDDAGTWYGKAATVVQGLESHIVKAKIYETQGHYFWDTEQIPEAIDAFKKAQSTFADLGFPLGYDHMAQIITRLKRHERSPRRPKGY
ncbi:MAG: hypothetical protein IID18_09960 [Nitrospinae bacterium]|nr:hypothetical protein [Nitrospinota bacterium]